MDNEIFTNTLNSIQEKLGEEAVAKIADDLGTLKTAQNSAMAEQAEFQKKLDQTIKDKDDMQKANARLLQQIPMGEPTNNFAPSFSKQEDKTPFDPRSVFDENGNLKK